MMHGLDRRQVGPLFLVFLILAAAFGCVRETEKRKITPATLRPQTSAAKAEQRRVASPTGPIVTAVMLDPAPYLPSVYSQEGLDALRAALQSRGFRVLPACGWDELFETERGVKRTKAELAIIVAFQDQPRLATVEASEQSCACKFSGSVVEVASGRVLHREEAEHEGTPGRGFEKACLSAVLASANAYSEVAAHILRNYEAGQTSSESN